MKMIGWTILVSIVSSVTTYLFMKYKTLENIILNLTDFTQEDIQRMKGWFRWKF
ncbi:hypothetical protein LKACC12383_01720 [Companilactobacillus kimchii]|uniref:Uncharacterized protein n=3 Tax=Companilactobacillus kimchii TaxID=2801452 RepID=A0ABR5NW90_9LACO|nr:hypothetical protein [Companilactobacillus kimchii]KRK53104.1 hypothetical protein FC97_GL001568 [Companilactobacillus kimchii DSM 13961 = JCM 10707]OWF32847.1 hypothetical protein LKACC12383_01720 [Companilactobacillus kimchii]